MKWFQNAGNGKWIETDGPFSIFGATASVLEIVAIGVVALLFIFRPIEFFEVICKILYWIIECIGKSKLLHSLDSLGYWG